MAASQGQISVKTGDLVVTGTLTGFRAAEGDQLLVRGLSALISRVISTTEIQLKQPWPGPDIVAESNWDISLTGPYWNNSTTTNLRLSQLLSQFEAGPIKWDQAGPPEKRSEYNTQGVGFVYLSVGDPWTLYTKLANTGSENDWSPGQAIRGSAAESTVEAQAARDDARLAQFQAEERASVAAGLADLAGARATSANTSAVNASSASSDAAAHAANAAAYAAQVGRVIFDFNYSSDYNDTNDWNN